MRFEFMKFSNVNFRSDHLAFSSRFFLFFSFFLKTMLPKLTVFIRRTRTIIKIFKRIHPIFVVKSSIKPTRMRMVIVLFPISKVFFLIHPFRFAIYKTSIRNRLIFTNPPIKPQLCHIQMLFQPIRYLLVQNNIMRNSLSSVRAHVEFQSAIFCRLIVAQAIDRPVTRFCRLSCPCFDWF